jgi:hypothetical protein
MMKVAYSYGRFSSAKQEFGDSYRRQLESAKRWCTENGYTLSKKEFFDKAKSATKGENFGPDADLTKFIKLHAAGEIKPDEILIIDEISRFSRLPPNISTEYFLRAINSGIKVVFSGSYDKRIITAELLGKPSESHTLHSIITGLTQAHAAMDDNKRKIKEALDERVAHIKAGTVLNLNNPPKYFDFVASGEKQGKAFKGKYIFIPAREQIVRDFVKGVFSGKSLYQMAQDLNNLKIPTFGKGKEWHWNTIRDMLLHRSLMGEYMGVKNYFPAIVDEDEFLKIQNLLNSNKRDKSNRGKRATLTNIFKGLAHCSSCGKPMTCQSSNQKGYSYRYLRCGNYSGKFACLKSFLPLDKVERDFFINFIAKDPYKVIGNDAEELKEIKKERDHRLSRSNQIGDELKTLAKHVKDTPEFEEQVVLLKKEREGLKQDIDSLNIKARMIEDVPKNIEALNDIIPFADWFKEKKKRPFIRITRFEAGPDGEDVTKEYSQTTWENISKALQDNDARGKLRLHLTSFIKRIEFNARERNYSVFNLTGKPLYISDVFPSLTNKTEAWRNGIKSWTKKKTPSGQTVEIKRYQGRYKSKLPDPVEVGNFVQ